MSSRNGKIARLPAELRKKINTALYGGKSARSVLKWLNKEPDVKKVLARDFDGVPISEQNMSEWRQGGYLQYVAQRDLLDQAQETYDHVAEMDETVGDLADHLVKVLTARYGALLVGWNGETSPELEGRLKVLSGLTRWVLALQRGVHRTERLAMAQQRHDRAEGDDDIKWEEKMADLKSRGPLLEFAMGAARKMVEAERAEVGRRRGEDGGLRVEDGGWQRSEGGERKAEGGKKGKCGTGKHRIRRRSEAMAGQASNTERRTSNGGKAVKAKRKAESGKAETSGMGKHRKSNTEHRTSNRGHFNTETQRHREGEGSKPQEIQEDQTESNQKSDGGREENAECGKRESGNGAGGF